MYTVIDATTCEILIDAATFEEVREWLDSQSEYIFIPAKRAYELTGYSWEEEDDEILVIPRVKRN